MANDEQGIGLCLPAFLMFAEDCCIAWIDEEGGEKREGLDECEPDDGE